MLTVIGLGPGDASLLAPAAAQALADAQTVVGYTTYIELIDPALLDGKTVLATPMMREQERVGLALDAAQRGERTVIVSSGDAGIYGMSGLALEMAEQRGVLETLPIEVVPGIPALAAAASLLGAPLMHDFAVISLSDLLTEWELIERRLDAAAGADLTIVLYNPRSKRRAGNLARALEVVGAHTGPERVCGVVRNGYRDDQQVWCDTVGTLDTARVDMLCIVVIGNSTTRQVQTTAGTRLLTPRGYTAKYGPAQQTL